MKSGSHEFWDKHFGRLLFLLLDAGAERDVNALKVLQGLVESHSRRTHGYAHPTLVRLLECLGDKADVVSGAFRKTKTDRIDGGCNSFLVMC